jgi:hypothetical protein
MKNVTPNQQTMLATWQQHTYAEFVLKDADAALTTMTENPYVLLMEGLVEGLRRFREEAFPGYEDLFHKLAHAKAVPLRLDCRRERRFHRLQGRGDRSAG